MGGNPTRRCHNFVMAIVPRSLPKGPQVCLQIRTQTLNDAGGVRRDTEELEIHYTWLGAVRLCLSIAKILLFYPKRWRMAFWEKHG